MWTTSRSTPAEHGWVTVLIENLNRFLAKHLGRREVLSPWFDKHSLHGNSAIRDKIPEQARNSALFLAILSPGYVASDFCMREVQAFIESHGEGVDGRLFVVEHMPIPDNGNVPDQLRDLGKYRFWRMWTTNKV